MDQDRPFRKGRGAASNPAGRYEPRRVDPLPAGEDAALDAEEPAPLRTTVTPEASRSILTRNDSPDVPFDVSINPYKGCEHGCVYCFARPTHAYLGLSPGLDFETRIVSKPEGPRLLKEALRHPGYRCETIALGANTDPYQPVERRLRITRGLLEVLAEHLHPVTIVTKSDLVLRDLDLLGPLAQRRLAAVLISVTTLDRTLARRMEPRAPAPERRIAAMRALGEAGVPVGVLSSPMILGLNDHELEDLFGEWLQAHYPLKAARVLGLVRDTRGGRLYDARFGARMRGTGPQADLLKRRFEIACDRLGLSRDPDPLDVTLFRVPPGKGEQIRLFP